MIRKLLPIFTLILCSCPTIPETAPETTMADPDAVIAAALEKYGMDPEEKARVQATELLTNEARQEMIDKQFDPWDGAHIALKQYTRSQMDNPRSFDHVETIYYDDFDSIRVYMTYRGTNAFNAIVTNRIGARFDLQSRALEALER